MRKRIYSILSMFLIAITCVLAGACGNKYGKMEFQVLYAFSADAKTWHDGTDGIFIAYGENDELLEGEEQSSLIFNENDQASLFIKVKIKNVKAKHLGSIAMSFSSVSGLEFSSKMISRNKAIEVPISKDVKISTQLKLYESNSGKSFSTGFNVSRRLESLGANLDVNPAMFSTSTLNLTNLTNDVIIYNPSKTETNETGVKYSLGGIGHVTATGFSADYNAEQTANFVELTDNVLKIKDDSFINVSNVIEIIATSIYHDGVENVEDLIQTPFYVYVVKPFMVDEQLLTPTVKFENNEGKTVDAIHIYENGGKYATSTVFTNTQEDVKSISIPTYNGTGMVDSVITEAVYVKNSNGYYVKYNFTGENQQEGINGLSVFNSLTDNQLIGQQYKFAIFDRNINQNTIKIAYEFNGLNFSYGENVPKFEKEIVVNKLAVPKFITINNTTDLANGQQAEGVIYVTSSSSYGGLDLTINANPTTNSDQTIEIKSTTNLIVAGAEDKGDLNYSIKSGQKIQIKLKDKSSGDASLTLTTSAAPYTYYNGNVINDDAKIEVVYKIKKVVTANKLSFGEYKNGEFTEFAKNEESLIRAQGGGYLYVKASHLGQEMDGNSVKLYSANDSILFTNGTCETTLNTGYITSGKETGGEGSYFSIYKVQIKSPGAVCEGNVNIVAGDGQISVSDNVLVKAVNVANANAIIQTSASNAISVSDNRLANCFMLKNMSSSDFKLDLIQGSAIQSGAIKDEKIQVVNSEFKYDFKYLEDVTPLSNTTFVVSAQNTGTEILKATIQQYCWNEEDSLVEVLERSVYIQIAVFNPITNISVVATKEDISYVSPYYEEAGKTTIKFTAKTFQGQTITDKVIFDQTPETPEVDSVTVGGLAGIKAGIVEQINNSSKIDGIDALDDETYNCENSLGEFTKEFELALIGEVNISKLTIKFTALTKGVESGVNSTITINIKQPNKATRIQINGKALNFNAKDKVDAAELEMSFIKVEDGGFAEAEFDAKILFGNSDGIKFDNIETDLAYFINRYTLTDNNSIDVNNKIDEHDDFFIVTLANGKVNIKALKRNGGGIFQLVLATKDSFVGADKENAKYNDFETCIAITIRVLDGDQVAFAIKTEEDFADVNKNLRSRFALYNDVEITKDMDPLGYRDGQLSAFEGVLTGRPDGYGEGVQYQITQTINKMALSDTYGNVAGLFGVVGVNGKVENLKYVLRFKNTAASQYNFIPTSGQGFNLGAIAGVNLGKLNNVAVTMKSNVSLRANANIEINVGGLVGLNENKIANCSIKNDYEITVSAENVNMNIGLIAGTNKGEIAGRYKGKSDLNNYVFDVVSNLIVKNQGDVLNVGGVAGSNTGKISNLLVGGKIASNKGYLGGFAGTSSGNGNTISTVVALSLNVACKDSAANNGIVGGIVGSADATKIDYVKYLSAKTYFNNEQTSTDGQVVGQIAGGIVGESNNNIRLNECSVESFVNGLDAISGSTVGGLVATGTASVSNSFVKANLEAKGSGSVYTSAGDLTNVYFIGDVTGEFAATSYGTYKFDSTTISISQYMTLFEFEYINDWSNAYFLKDGEEQYVKVSEEDSEQEGGKYYQLDVDEWTRYAKGLVSSGWTTDWKIQQYYNAVKINGVEVFLPYLLRTLEGNGKEPLMIVEPRKIVATVNVDYVTKHNSDVVEDYEDATTQPNYTITESIIVNYFNQAGDEANSYKLISEEGGNNGLIDIDLLPEDAQGLYSFKIIEGYEFAYIDDNKQLVITDVSGNQRILIEIYSGFNPDCKTYVAVYSQNLLTELKLTSNNVERLDKEFYKANIFVGQDDLILSIDAVNNFNNIDYGSIFNVDSISDYLVLSVDSDKLSNSVLKCKEGVVDFSNVKISFNNASGNVDKIVNGYNEILTIKLCLKAAYFNKGETYFVSVNSLIPVGEVSLQVYVHNSAEGIIVNGDDTEISSKDGMSFEVFLSTETIDIKNDTELPFDPSTKVNSDGIIEIEEKDLSGIDVNTAQQIKRDSIKIEFEYGDDSQAEIDRILAEVNKSKEKNEQLKHFADLFEISVNRSFYVNQNNEILGYYYYVELMLKDEHKYRSLNSEIRFNIKVSALTNPEVNNGDGLSVVIKPTTLTTIKMSSYVVENISYRTDYSELVANNNKEISIIEPGGSGNVMIINLEPSYAKVGSVLIKSSQINVPKLGSVGINFTQLVFDETLNRYTTLYGANAPEQTDEGLKLNRISTIGEDFTGVIYVLMQLPRMEGVAADINVTLEVETSDGVKVEHTKTLATTNLPGIEVSFDEQYKISDETNGYYVQTGSENNEIEIKVIGYTFSKTPEIKVSWDDAVKEIYGDNALSENKQILTVNEEEYYAIDYVSRKLDNITNAVYDPTNNSYTLKLRVGIKKLLMAPIKISVYLEVTTKDGEIVTSEDGSNDNYVVLWPTDYLLSSYGVKNLSNGRKNVAISSTSILELSFNTQDSENDYSNAIFSKLIEYSKTGNVIDESKIAKMFTFYNEEKGANDSFDSFLNVQGTEAEKTKAFEFNVAMHEINGNATPILEITGLGQFNKRITLSIPYEYTLTNGIYKLTFGDSQSHNPFEFELNIYAATSENEIPIYTADEIYDSKTGKWDLVEGAYYVLMADIELENVVPITTKIGQLDGNNRTISIKSFKIDDQATEYGLFANIGTYEVTDQETETKVETPTILKNVIVDYSKFGASGNDKLPDIATIPLANSTAEKLTIGGLVGTNNGGLIYNCDVVNLNNSLVKRIDVIVPTNATVKFGGLVGENAGVITSSRVGRNSYERVTIANGINSQRTIYMGGLSFSVYHSQNDEGNQFKNEVAGFVATNSGTISNSFVTRTNLTNYSTNESLNRTAGFVATNSGTILSSYVKSDESTINKDTPRSTGYVIEQKGNGILAGFVYANSGTISNAYSNVQLQTKSAYIAGFVYDNMSNGTISETYAASTMNSASGDNNAEQPFVGVSNAGKLLSEGTIKNSYYLMRNEVDNPYMQDEKDVAYALNVKNFQVADNLTNFAFVLSESITERRQGVWSYYTLTNKNVVLPELMSANNIAYSYRYESEVFNAETGEKETILVSSSRCELGSEVNPYAISSPEEFNKYLKINEKENSNGGHHFRLINNIDFSEPRFGGQAVAVATKTDFSLGSADSTTSFEGNGLSIKNIYLDINNTQTESVEAVGLFAEINNAYVKNINLSFATNKEFSTKSAIYSGGLAGKIHNSAIMNIKITGSNTFVGRNFVGGLAGLIDGKSLIYGIEASVNVKAESKGQELYYNQSAYEKLGRISATGLTYDQFIESDKLSYAGAIAGVIDIEKRPGVEFNVHSVTVRGDLITAKVDANSKKEPNISGQFAGGIAGYAGSQTNALRLNFIMNKDESIYGEYAAGGLFGVSLGRMVASQVSAKEDVQYDYDTEIGEYIIDTESDKGAVLDETKIGNVNLLESENYVGGLVGIGLGTTIYSNYSKATVKDGVIVGGLIGLNIASGATYSYAVPYINSSDKLEKAGGLFGLVCPVSENPQAGETNRFVKLQEYSKLIAKLKGLRNGSTSNIQFTYSSLIIDETFETKNDVCLDYVVADYILEDYKYVTTSNSTALKYVYYGQYKNNNTIQSQTKEYSNSILIDAYELYNLEESTQELTFNEVFSGWASEKYWSLDSSKYLPLLTTKVVDNFIIIDDYKDFDLIAANPSLNYKIIKDIDVPVKYTNWVINCGEKGFSGILLGELETDSSSRPKVRILGLKLTTDGANQTSGFINKCCGATISNIEIVWVNQKDNKSSILTTVDLDYVSGFVCEDAVDGEKAGSLITNVVVRAEKYNNSGDEGSIFYNKDRKIQGFGGIVGKGEGTTILGCEFISPITAKISNIVRADENPAFGGIAGLIESSSTQNSNVNNNVSGNGNADSSKLQGTALISGSNIGAYKKSISGITYPITQFNITVENCSADIGGVVGNSNDVAISTISVGSLEAATTNNADYKSIKMNVTIKNDDNSEKSVNIGGVGGFIKDGVVTGVTDLADIVIGGTASKTSANVGGFAGYYSLSGQNLTNGIRKSEVQATIKRGSVLTLASLRVSTGFGTLASNSKVEQCLFDGEVNTNQPAEESTDSDEGVSIPTVYAGAVAAYIDTEANATLEQIMTNVALYAGHSTTKSLYVGGLIGGYGSGKITIESCSAWGRVVPVTSENSSYVYAGGFVGLANQIKIANSYSLSSVILSSLADQSIAKLTAGALVGEIKNCDASEVTNVYYSTDIALCVDENYINHNPIGTNLSAETMWSTQDTLWVTNLKGEGEVWVQFGEKNKTIPHLSALEDSLKAFGIYGPSGYAEGSVMNPEAINSDKNFNAEPYKYYRLKNLKTLPKFSGNLKGVLIGSDDVVGEESYGYTIPKNRAALNLTVSDHSAISNLHVILESCVEKEQYVWTLESSPNGFIATKNEGVIFNCSVQGNLVNIKADKGVGLITGSNDGLISHSYSSAEIVVNNINGYGIEAKVGGITYSNSGKMLSNYFTGYINSMLGAAGMFVEGGQEGYLYNNYMGGVVVEKTESGNKFAGNSFNGSNNYIDKYSDIDLFGSTTSTNLASVTTASLMMNKKDAENKKDAGNKKDVLLKGEWYTPLQEDGCFDEGFGNTFGRNYNYPVYRFNKMSAKSATSVKSIDYQKQLKTGTGIKEDVTKLGEDNDELATGNADPEKEASLVNRYNYLLKKQVVITNEGTQSIQRDTYTNAYKIPHYGVLQSVQALLNRTRNYVLIYDIDARKQTNVEEDKITADAWKAIGSQGKIHGFNLGDAVGFSGVFITNRFFAQTEGDSDNGVCTIQGISQEGLFANVNNAFIGNINLGSFYELKESGAVAVNIGSSDLASSQAEGSAELKEPTVYIESISFKSNSIISGGGGGDNYYAALVGSIHNNIVVNINNFNTTKLSTSNLTLQGKKDTVGLIAGKIASGNIQFKDPLTADMATTQSSKPTKVEKKLIALFDGNNIAGGLVGEMHAGKIVMTGYQVLISKTGDKEESTGDVENYTNVLGGVVGKVTGAAEIVDAHVTMFSSKEDSEVEIYANNFGGFIGVVDMDINETNKEVKLTNTQENSSVLDIQGTGMKFYFNTAEYDSFYYGLLVGNLEGGLLSIDKFELLTKIKEDENLPSVNDEGESETPLFKMQVVGGKESAYYKDDNNTYGLGGFVGRQAGSLTISKYVKPTVISVSAEGIPNTGGVAGVYAKSGDVKLDMSALQNGILQSMFIVSGSTNVGGLFGLVETSSFGDFESIENDSKVVSLLNAHMSYSKVIVHSDSAGRGDHMNYGGLFGKWTSSSTSNAKIASQSSNSKLIVNYNPIIIAIGCGGYYLSDNQMCFEQYEGFGALEEACAYNIGGVVGSLNVGVSNLQNNADIQYFNQNEILKTEGSDSTIIEAIYNRLPKTSIKAEGENIANYFVCRAVNVGGVAGVVSQAILTNAANLGKVTGYQNVGGLVGKISGATLTADAGFTPEIPENSPKGEQKASVKSEETTKFVAHSVGDVSGVINVGGAVGVAQGIVEYVKTSANVYGNTGVGGLVGMAVSSTIEGCVVGNESDTVKVRGVYYSHSSLNVSDPTTGGLDFIPTSVGGLIGTLTNSSNISTHCSVNGCSINNVLVTSSDEGGSGSNMTTISDNINNMLNVAVGSGNSDSIDKLMKYKSLTSINEEDKDTVLFSDLRSGFGGLIGTTHSDALTGASGLIMNNVTVKVALGVNVGYVYGSYTVDGSAANTPTKETNDAINPNITEGIKITSDSDYLTVDGAYNIGGVAGLLSSAPNLTITGLNLNNKVVVQSEMIGINVGGLFGKTLCDEISGMKLTDNDNITIETDRSYYIGGLIGTAQVTSGAQLNGLSVPDSGIFNGDDKKNVGAFIGRLKVVGESSKETVVDGSHNYTFTINTIENENYLDGAYKKGYAYESDGIIHLNAEAYYINQDKFKISGSDTIFYNNPLNEQAKGWSREYTGFRKIQRCIPAGENEGAGWDSTTPFYDAANITHVELKSVKTKDGNGKNPGEEGYVDTWKNPSRDSKEVYDELYQANTDIKFTVYNTGSDELLYAGMGIARAQRLGVESFLQNEDQYKANNDDYKTNPENWDKNDVVYATLCDYYTSAGWFMDNIVMNLFGKDGQVQTRYIDYNHDNVVDKNLEKFNFKGTYKSLGQNGYNNAYSWIGGDNNLHGDGINCNLAAADVKYQRDVNDGTLIDPRVCYFVENYLGEIGDATKGKSKESKGVYFVFEAIFENDSLQGCEWYSHTDEVKWYDFLAKGKNFIDHATPEKIEHATNQTSPSGSIFDASGLYSENVHKMYSQNSVIDGAAIARGVIEAVVTIVITIITMGVGGAFAGAAKTGTALTGTMVKQGIKRSFRKALAKLTLKEMRKKFLKKIAGQKVKETFKGLAKRALKQLAKNLVVASIGAMWVIGRSVTTQSLEPGITNHGFIGNAYMSDIIYASELADSKVKLKKQGGQSFNGEQEGLYIELTPASARPADFNKNYYVPILLLDSFEQKDGGVLAESTTIDMEILEHKTETTDPNDKITPEQEQSIQKLVAYEEELIQVTEEEAEIKSYNNVEITFTNFFDKDDKRTDTYDDVYIGQYQGVYYTFEKKYVYENGKYYINSELCNVEKSRVTLGFEPREIVVGVSQEKELATIPDYIVGKDGYYVSGSFDGTYSPDHVVDDAKEEKTLGYQPYPGNNLEAEFKDSVWTYKINGVDKAATDVENDSQKFEYEYIKAGYAAESYEKKGYHYFTTAYFTAEGNSGGWQEFEKTAKGEDDPTKPTGYVKYGTFTNIDKETVGEKWIHGVHYITETVVNKENNTSTTTYYQLTDVLDNRPTDYDNPTDNTMRYVKLYPNRFINPYLSNMPGYDDAQSKTLDKLVFTGDFVCKLDNGKEDDGDKTIESKPSITYAPTYYLYEGGYIIDDDGAVYRMLTDTEKKLGFTINNGTKTLNVCSIYQKAKKDEKGNVVMERIENTISIETFANALNGTYKDYTYDGDNVNETFKEKDGKLYIYDSDFVVNASDTDGDGKLDGDGLLYVQYVNPPGGCAKNRHPFEGMYLSNSEVGLFTYYKYDTGSDKKVDFNGVLWIFDPKIDDSNNQTYRLVPKDTTNTTLNGSQTRFVESCKVIFGGRSTVNINYTEGDQGSINIETTDAVGGFEIT